MPYAINAFFDAATEETIRSVWQEIAGIERAAYLHQAGIRPHIKLAIYQTLELSAVEQPLQALAAAVDRLPVTFKQVGFFPNPRPTVFLGPVVTTPLLDLQNRVCESLRDVAADFVAAYFATGQWIPHCLLAVDIDPEDLFPVLAVGTRLPLPLEGEIQGVGVVEFRPSKLLCHFPLA